MHEVLREIKSNLQTIVEQLPSVIPNDEPFGNLHGNWSFPGLTRAELVEEVQSIIEEIDRRGAENLGENEARLIDYVRRLNFLRSQTLPQISGNAAAGIPAFLFTMQGLRKALVSALVVESHAEALVNLRKTTSQLRGMEAQLKALEPRSASLSAMVDRIEQAYNAADQLPADLESLSETRQKIAGLAMIAGSDHQRISGILEEATAYGVSLENALMEANSILQRCETAYSAATSVGLAAAFGERSLTLSRSMWVWVLGLVVALGMGSYFGSMQVNKLSNLGGGASASVVVLNLLLSLLSVGAPIWFAWLATKQIGQRFRLAEDYAFKASVSRAYEGFRREAARFDKDMEAQLLNTALKRLDELPLRLVETDSHGSPWHELASSDLVRQAMRVVPGFAEDVKSLASGALASVRVKKIKASIPEVGGEQ